MKITSEIVKKFDNTDSKVLAIAKIVLEDSFVINNIRIIEGETKRFAAMPNRKLPNGEYRDIAHPINEEVRQQVEAIILEAYDKLLETNLEDQE